jgi:hypothetical protein
MRNANEGVFYIVIRACDLGQSYATGLRPASTPYSTSADVICFVPGRVPLDKREGVVKQHFAVALL